MTVTPLPQTGNSSKFRAVSKRGEFTVALSFTLRTKVWQLGDADAELAAATELCEAIVSRHDPGLPFKPLYIFAEHNSEPTYAGTLQRIRKYGVTERTI